MEIRLGSPNFHEIPINRPIAHEGYKHCKAIAMDGDAKNLLKATYSEHLVVSIDTESQRLKDPGLGLADSFIEAIGQHRFWEREKTDKIPT